MTLTQEQLDFMIFNDRGVRRKTTGRKRGRYAVRFIGTGRCGTRFASRLSGAFGLKVGHERVYADGVSSCLPWHVFEHGEIPMDFDRTVHIVREPLACIASLTTLTPASWNAFGRYTPTYWRTARWKDKLLTASEHYLHWNRLCAERADVTLRVEDLTEAWFRVYFADIVRDEYTGEIDRTTNTRKHPQLSREKLEALPLGEEVIQLAREYGYE